MTDAQTEIRWDDYFVTVSANQMPEPIISTVAKPQATCGTMPVLAMANQPHVFRLCNLLTYHALEIVEPQDLEG